MSTQKTRKFDVWEFRTEGGMVKQEIRVTTSGPLKLIAEMKDGTVLTGTDATNFSIEVNDYIQGINKLEWEKVIVVVTGGGTPGYFGAIKEDAMLQLAWAVRYKSKGPKGTCVWRRELNDKERIEHHHGVHAGFDGKDRVIPYSEAAEIFLQATIKSIKALEAKITAYFQDETLELKIAQSTGNLLGATPQPPLLP